MPALAPPPLPGSVIVYLIGYPGVGKYTIAHELARRCSPDRHMVVVDNHYANNVIFALVGADGKAPLGPEVWAQVSRVREAVLDTVETLSPQEWSFVFTHVLIDDPADAELFARVEQIAAARSSRLVPVRLTCRVDELTRRVVDPDRTKRLKWRDPDGLRNYVATRPLLRVDHAELLELDVTDLTAAEAAAAVFDHLSSVTAGQVRA